MLVLNHFHQQYKGNTGTDVDNLDVRYDQWIQLTDTGTNITIDYEVFFETVSDITDDYKIVYENGETYEIWSTEIKFLEYNLVRHKTKDLDDPIFFRIIYCLFFFFFIPFYESH